MLCFDWLWLMILAYVWMVLYSICLLWYCAMHSVLCSNSMLSGCSSSSFLRHFWVVPCGSCRWHRYLFWVAFAPHLSVLVLDLSSIIVWIVCPNARCGEWKFDVWASCKGVCCTWWGRN